jgi:hypothetical protein
VAGDTIITVVGNLTADPELRFTPSGAAVANFTVASTPRILDRQKRLQHMGGQGIYADPASIARSADGDGFARGIDHFKTGLTVRRPAFFVGSNLWQIR